MTLRAQLVFLITVLVLLGGVHGFLYLHLAPLLPGGGPRHALALLFLVLGTAYIVGKALERSSPRAAAPFLQAGASWFAVMAYLFLGCLAADALLAVWLGLHALGAPLPVPEAAARVDVGRVFFGVWTAASLMALGVGHRNVRHPRLRRLTLEWSGPRPLRLAVASDVHLCALVSPRRLHRITTLLQQGSPDLILFPGDLVDEDLERSPRGPEFRALLASLRAPLGVFAVTGNHEWIGGVEGAVRWIESCGIQVLRDRAVDSGPCVLAGRDDAAGPRFGAGAGRPLAALLAGTDRAKPLIVIDHQPVRLREAVAAGAALILCGHTHHGQLWPFQWITQGLFEVSWGEKRIGATHVVVSCGAGAWGPQTRTNSRCEVLQIDLVPSAASPRASG